MREWLSAIRLRLGTLLHRRRLDRDLHEEMAFHLAMREERLREAGVNDRDAAAAARRSFGNVTLLKEACRELWTFASLERWLADVRYAARVLAKQRTFAAVAVLSLAIGIGANSAILGVARAVLLDPLPVPVASQLRILYWSSADRPGGRHADFYQFYTDNYHDPGAGRAYTSNFSYLGWRALREATAGTGNVFAFAPLEQINISIDGHPLAADGLMVSDNYFSALGVALELGRPLGAGDSAAGSSRAAVISHAFWTRAFGGDPSAVGAIAIVNGSPVTIVGVTRRDFYGISKGGLRVDITVPLTAQPVLEPTWTPKNRSLVEAENYLWLHLMARLAPRAGERQFSSAATSAYARYAAGSPDASIRDLRSPEIMLVPGSQGVDYVQRQVARPLLILTGAAVVVLLIACLNLAGLMLARGMARQREMHIRLALGSGRLRLIRQLLAESLLLALVGGAAGLLLADWGGRTLAATLTAQAGPIAFDGSLDLPTLLTAAGVSLAATLLFGLLPALGLSAGSGALALKQAPFAGRTRHGGARRVLMAGQVAISVVLLAGAAMFLRTLVNLTNVPTGFSPKGLILFRLDPARSGYDASRVESFYSRALERLRALPGVASATLVENPLLAGQMAETRIAVAGGNAAFVDLNGVGTRFFETMGIRTVAGRAFTAQDDSRSMPVAVINESAARAFFGHESPLGRRFRRSGYGRTWDIEVVGVVSDTKYQSLRDAVRPTVFVPYAQDGGSPGPLWVVLRSSLEATAMVGGLRAAMREIDGTVPPTDLKTQMEQIGETIGGERFFAHVLVFFAFFALLAACIGLYGMTAYSAAGRTAEIGVRIAFGASRASVLWMVLRQVVAVTAAGLVLGVPLAIAASRVVRSMLFGIEPGDPATIAAAVALMAGVTLVAGWLPARRASRMDPVVALRYE